MTPHTTQICPVPASAPVAYRLADGIERLAERADSLAWGNLPEPEGRVIAYAELHPGPWRQHVGQRAPVAWAIPIEVEFGTGERMTGKPADFSWQRIADLPEASVMRYRVLAAVADATPTTPSAGRRRPIASRALPRRRAGRSAARWLLRQTPAACPWWAM